MSDLRIDTVRASVLLAQGQTASGFKPLPWKTFRNESQDVKDPGNIINHNIKKNINTTAV